MRCVWSGTCAVLLGVTVLCAGVAAQDGEEGREPMWSDSLKNIEAGPGILDIGGSLRLRTELFESFKIKRYAPDDSDQMLLERLRLDFNYQLQDNLRAFIQLQDAHFWLSDLHPRDFGPTCPYENPLDLKKGYVEWTHINDTPFGVRLGRQAIWYRDKRVWGPGDWGNTGRYTWDALKLLIDTETVSTDLIGAQRVISDKHTFDDTHFDFDAYGVYSKIHKLPFDLDLLYILKYDDHGTTVGESGIGNLESHSVGAYVDGTLRENWDWGGLAVYQFGDWGDDDIKAFGSNARLGYTFDTAWKPRVGAEYSYASGDDDPNDGDHEQFDGLFGAVDKFYGRMNMFAWMNLHDYQTSFSVKPKKNLNVSLDYHYFQIAEEEDGWYYCHGRPIRQDPAGNSNNDLGHEVDLLAKWRINEQFELFSGYSHFWPESFVRQTGDADDADWFFFQVTYFF